MTKSRLVILYADLWIYGIKHYLNLTCLSSKAFKLNLFILLSIRTSGLTLQPIIHKVSWNKLRVHPSQNGSIHQLDECLFASTTCGAT